MPHEMFKRMLEKKKPLSDVERDAKSGVLKDLRDYASGLMKERLDGLKKVTVASDSEEGLKEGLEKAEEILETKEESSEEEDPEDMHRMPDGSLMPDEEMDYSEHMKNLSEEEIDQYLKELMALKEQLQAKKM